MRLESLNPHDPPRIQMNYLEEESDRKVLIEVARLGRRIFHTAEFEKYFEEETNPGEKVQTDEEWTEIIRN